MIIPIEILLAIYEEADYKSRITMNKVYNWSFYSVNPYFDYEKKTNKRLEPRNEPNLQKTLLEDYASFLNCFSNGSLTYSN